MPYPARWILVGLAVVFCAMVILKEKDHFDKATFSVPKTLASASQEKPFYKEEFINSEQDLPFVHVASLMELDGHTLAALWYGGPYEYCHDNAIYLARWQNGSWQEPRTIMTSAQSERDLKRPLKSLGNPLLLSNPDGTLRLLFITIAMGKWSGSQLNSAVSRDDGLTWSRAERLTLSPLYNFSELVRNRPIPLVGGGWCAPIYQEFIGKFPELLWLKEVNGKLIAQKSRIDGGCSTLQPSLIPLDDKRAVVLLRDFTHAKRIFLSHSEDAGLTWSKPVPTNLPNPDAGISGLKLPDGRLLVAFNDSTTARENLSLALSGDEGRSWKKLAVLDHDPNAFSSYPFMMSSSDGLVHVAFTYEGDAIRMVSFNESWIAEQEARNARP
jgi:predicted neuraminidase